MSRYKVVFNKTLVEKELYGSEHIYKKGTIFAEFSSKEKYLNWKRHSSLVTLECFGHNNYI